MPTIKLFLITVLLQVAGPLYFGFDKWANVIQYLGGFGMVYAFWSFSRKIHHLHQKHDQIQEHLKRSTL